MSKDLSGLVVAILTPFADNDRIDEVMFVKHLEFLAEHGVTKILVGGTTGEFFSLSGQERQELFQIARKNFSGKLFYHAGSDSLIETQQQCIWAQDSGADAVVALTPYYLADIAKEGIVDYFNALSDSVKVPFILYNFPKHTNNAITADMLAGIDHFGIKDSSRDLELIKATEHYYVGGDTKILQTYRAGGFGFVSGRVNFIPEPYVAIENALAAGDANAAEQLQEKITKLSEAMGGGNSIAKFKYAMSIRCKGYPSGVRLPLKALAVEEALAAKKLVNSCV
ncbi:hypothetical protein LCGC14_1852730 [marine sediment metagenome]|uniref:Dihydrodipicolinate synthase n=1 Tax=marine sediment metagenome TaxID=412755 RepID=A0A0F9IPF6_9ZZZZ|nr:dihydrodipicolinate synthase family protein [Phycisphaerales bacterium]